MNTVRTTKRRNKFKLTKKCKTGQQWNQCCSLSQRKVPMLFFRLPDKVNFWFGWLSWFGRWNDDWWSITWILVQHIDECFLLMLLKFRNHWSLWWRISWRFNENNLVVFLWWRSRHYALWRSMEFWIWWRNVYIDMFLY